MATRGRCPEESSSASTCESTASPPSVLESEGCNLAPPMHVLLYRKRKQWVRARPTVSNRFGRTVLLNKVAADVKEAHVVAALRRFGAIVRVRFFKRVRGTQGGGVKVRGPRVSHFES